MATKFDAENYFVKVENSEIVHMVLTVVAAKNAKVSEANIELLKEAVMLHNKDIEQ